MISRLLIICALFCQCLILDGQFLDDFSDSDLNSNPLWEGNVQDFIVTTDQKLQLNAGETSTSQLFTKIILPDSIQWNFEAFLDFAPSANNRLRVYLAIDQQNTELASGYFLEIGENGNGDALNFYKLTNGSADLLASGEASALATEPAYVKVSATYFPGGEWSIATAYQENTPTSVDLELFDDNYDFSGNQIFMLECNYTSSRRDKFFFDDIGIKKYERDREGPIVLSVALVDASTISIRANEKLEAASAQEKGNYIILNFAGNISDVTLTNNQTEVILNLSEPLSSGTPYSISISNLKDENANTSEVASFELFVLDEAAPGDIVINEIMFNPETGGSDYVEILNISNKYIFLGNLSLLNSQNSDLKPITSDLTLNPGQHLCLTEDVGDNQERYMPDDTARFLEMDIPAFNNDEGNVSLIHSVNDELIDSYEYNESQHFSQLDDLNGVSLERISPFSDKWFSASSLSNFGTPGYRNSVYLDPTLGSEEVLSFENKTFSPNQDGIEDQLIIKYNLPGNGYLVDIHIFDQYGRLVRTLINNELFTEEGFVFWDGLSDSGESLSIGIYFVVFDAYNPMGNVIVEKKPTILADFLD